MPTTALDAAALEKLIAAAVAAPSLHNSQPWRFRFVPEIATLEVRAAAQGGLRCTDPAGSALHLSAGAALFNLRVAATHLGREPVVRLLPRPGEPELLASVRLAGPSRNRSGHRRDLYDAIWRRRTSRMPFHSHQLKPHLVTELIEAAHLEGAELRMADPRETVRLLRLTAEAELRNTRDPDRSKESRRWIRGPEGGDTGLPGAALGPQDASGRLPMRNFSALRHPGALPSAAFEAHPTIAVLSTAHDRRADWLRAGQALEHVLLVLTAHGLRSSMLHQAVEWPDLRWALRNPPGTAERAGNVHMLVRIGYGPTGQATPRRSPEAVLEFGHASPGEHA